MRAERAQNREFIVTFTQTGVHGVEHNRQRQNHAEKAEHDRVGVVVLQVVVHIAVELVQQLNRAHARQVDRRITDCTRLPRLGAHQHAVRRENPARNPLRQ